ncbi:hypothetical protein KB559_14375 [Paenibacillus sp. Marseille-P2973]|uniref:hypothetical protein n=1 Tax=Paenibacillus sp. Marseille-P2973 TaxID=1871032 RepID=UPI001B36351F|nr:hypothetical protein [Paenibacillus sp. Marseille-P2973]MBQ4900015.1 hypothetical protein [Paenibacillus sp. Marseille-P2973]
MREELAGFEELLNELQRVTDLAVSRLDQMTEEELTFLADQRESLVKRLEESDRSELNDSHKVQIRYILSFDEAIQARMRELKREAEEWLLRQRQIRNQQSAYHQSYLIDGMFIDHRK